MEDVDRAAESARAAFELAPWRRLSGGERGKLLYRLAELIEQNSDELAWLDAINAGKPIKESLAVDLPLAISCFRYFAG